MQKLKVRLAVALGLALLVMLPVFHYFQTHRDLAPAWDMSYYILQAQVPVQHLYEEGVFSFFNSALYQDKNERGILHPFVLSLILPLTKGAVGPALQLVNFISIFIVAFALLSIFTQYFKAQTSILLAFACLGAPWIYSNAIVFKAELPMLASFLLVLMLWITKPQKPLYFFLALTFASLCRPAESLVFFAPILAYQCWQVGFRKYLLILVASAIAVLSLFLDYKNPHIFQNRKIAMALVVMLFAGAAWYRQRKEMDSWVSSALLYIGFVWLWYIPTASSVVEWLLEYTVNDATVSMRAHSSVWENIGYLIRSAGYLPVAGAVAGLIYGYRAGKIKSPQSKILVVTVFLLPLLGLLSKSADMKYYNVNFVLVYMLMLTTATVFFKKISKAWLGLLAIGLFAIALQIVNLSARPVSWVDDYIGAAERYQIADNNVVGQITDALHSAKVTGLIAVVQSGGDYERILEACYLQVKATEIKASFGFRLIEDLFSRKTERPMDGIKRNFSFLLVGPRNVNAGSPEYLRKNQLSLDMIKQDCKLGAEKCILSSPQPFLSFEITVDKELQTIQLWKLKGA